MDPVVRWHLWRPRGSVCETDASVAAAFLREVVLLTYDSLLSIFAIMSCVSTVVIVVIRVVVRKQSVDRVAREITAAYTGEVIDRQKVSVGFDANYSCGLTIRCDDGSTIVTPVPMLFEDRFPVGCRVVKYSGERYPVRAGTPPQNPDSDHVVAPCYRTSGGLAVHVRPNCHCAVRRH